MPEDRPLVADSGPLIALASIEQLHLLERLYSAVLVPSAVMREVVEAGRGRPGSREVQAVSRTVARARSRSWTNVRRGESRRSSTASRFKGPSAPWSGPSVVACSPP